MFDFPALTSFLPEFGERLDAMLASGCDIPSIVFGFLLGVISVISLDLLAPIYWKVKKWLRLLRLKP